ncbi:MAG: TonB protein, partial [Caulobacteraceae bacterium]|nr:TonB protein [Caulobacteraceae bacterium]
PPPPPPPPNAPPPPPAMQPREVPPPPIDIPPPPPAPVQAQPPSPQPPVQNQNVAVTAPPSPPAPPAPPTVRPPAVYTNADWLGKPTNAQMVSVYPPRAAEAGIGGNVTMACQVTVTGQVTGCRVTVESPNGEGFGAAALKLQSLFKMRPRLQDGQPVGGTATIPVRFDPPQ